MRLPINLFLLLLFVLILGATTRMVTTFLGLWLFLAVLIGLIGFVTFQKIHAPKASSTKSVKPLVLKLCFTLAFLLIIGVTFANRRSFLGFDVMRMAVPAMQPTLQQGERFIVNTWAYQKRLPKRGDVVVHSFSGQKGLYVNRIVAIGGDSIEIRGSYLRINGQQVIEPYVLITHKNLPESITMPPTKVPAGQFFVMGDNRDASLGDSRFSGTIKKQQVVAQVADILTSSNLSRVGSKVP